MGHEENGFGFREIRSEQLTLADIPAADAEYWGAIDHFALSFDGYAHHPEDCADLANAAKQRYDETASVPVTLDELRTCLFYEQRRWRHFDEMPDPKSLRYIRSLVESIRAQVDDTAPA